MKQTHRCWAEIDRSALRHNAKIVRECVGSAEIVAVVKANAYGHGLIGVAETLADEAQLFGVVGDPMDEATDVSALISQSERDRVATWIAEAVADGAVVAAGGDVDEHGVLRPTVLANATPDMQVCRGEVFGPVVTVTVYDDFDEALAWPTTRATGCRRRFHRRPRDGAAAVHDPRLRRGRRQRGADLAR